MKGHELLSRISFTIYKAISISFYPLAFLHAWKSGWSRSHLIQRLTVHPEFEDKVLQKDNQSLVKLLEKPNSLVWFHAASVGECASALTIIRAMMFDVKHGMSRHFDSLLLTVSNPSAFHYGTKALASISRYGFSGVEISPNFYKMQCFCRILPVDTFKNASNFIQAYNPKLAVFIESEIWPLIFNRLNFHNIPLLLLDARLSKKSFQRWNSSSFSRSLANQVFGSISCVVFQTELQKQNFFKLGCKNFLSLPSLKFCSRIEIDKSDCSSRNLPALNNVLQKEVLSKSFIWIAASIHKGEFDVIIKAHKKIMNRISHEKSCILIFAPRYISSSYEIIECAVQNGIMREKIQIRSKKELVTEETEIFILDTLGELNHAYKSCQVAFIGNSVISPGGGHNFAEAIHGGCDVIHGPHFGHFDELSEFLQERTKTLCDDLFSVQKVASVNEIVDAVYHNFRHGATRGQAGQKYMMELEKEITDNVLQLISREILRDVIV